MSVSVIPSERYSTSGSLLSLTKGITAIDCIAALRPFIERYESTRTAVVAATTAFTITATTIAVLRRFGLLNSLAVRAAESGDNRVVGVVARLAIDSAASAAA